jgi:hypothetical protein
MRLCLRHEESERPRYTTASGYGRMSTYAGSTFSLITCKKFKVGWLHTQLTPPSLCCRLSIYYATRRQITGDRNQIFCFSKAYLWHNLWILCRVHGNLQIRKSTQQQSGNTVYEYPDIQTWNYNHHSFESWRTHVFAVTSRLERYSQVNGNTRHVSCSVKKLNPLLRVHGSQEDEETAD